MQVHLLSIIAQLQGFFTSLDPAYLDFAKIVVGCVGWIGGLVLFMWWKEKNKKQEPAMLNINQD